MDFHRETFNQYFIIIASIAVTNNSQIIIYKGQSHINSGSMNHNSGSVIVVGIIQNRRSLLLEIWFSFRNGFAIAKRIIVSITIAINRA